MDKVDFMCSKCGKRTLCFIKEENGYYIYFCDSCRKQIFVKEMQ